MQMHHQSLVFFHHVCTQDATLIAKREKIKANGF
jgi:hypothetical protein